MIPLDACILKHVIGQQLGMRHAMLGVVVTRRLFEGFRKLGDLLGRVSPALPFAPVILTRRSGLS